MESGASTLNSVNLTEPQTNQFVRIQDQSSLGVEFRAVLDNLRSRANKYAGLAAKAADEQAGGPVNSPQLKQLTELYSYSVDTQLLMRTSSQLVSGMRQLMSGQ